MALRFDDALTAELRARLMRKGAAVAELLAEVLGGADGEEVLSRLGLVLGPGERAHEVLRRYLDLLEAKRRLIDADDDAFGRCDRCGADLGAVALREMPWADRCRRCSG